MKGHQFKSWIFELREILREMACTFVYFISVQYSYTCFIPLREVGCTMKFLNVFPSCPAPPEAIDGIVLE